MGHLFARPAHTVVVCPLHAMLCCAMLCRPAGTECCVYVVWTRSRTWITHVPINRCACMYTCGGGGQPRVSLPSASQLWPTALSCNHTLHPRWDSAALNACHWISLLSEAVTQSIAAHWCAVPCCAMLCRPWLHACLHLLLQIQQRYVAPESFKPPPTSLFWDRAALQDADTRLSELYRCACRVVCAAVLLGCVGMFKGHWR